MWRFLLRPARKMESLVFASMLGLGAWLCSGEATRAEYPEQLVKIVVPYGAGGYVDVAARVFADKLSAILGKPFVIENRPGAGGKIGEEFVAGSPPDGSTLMITFVTRPTVATAANPGPPDIDILKTFAVAGAVASSPISMAVAPTLGVKDFDGLIAKIKAEPGKHGYGTPGSGTEGQIVSAQIVKMFALDMVHVPYRVGSAGLTDLAAGVISWMVNTPASTLGLIQSGKDHPDLVINPTRVAQLPNVPTIQELGHSQLRYQVSMLFLLAPAQTPAPILATLNRAINEAQRDPKIVERLQTLSLNPLPDVSLVASRDLAEQQISAWSTAVSQILAP